MKNLGTILFLATALLSTACDKGDRSFSLLSDSDNFQQGANEVVQKKIDILWVVDNSGSMSPFQAKLAANFNSFISDFVTKGYDFHMAVIPSDAYRALPQFHNNPVMARVRDGIDDYYGSMSGGPFAHTGVNVINSTTPNIVPTFNTNAVQGDQGSGDERPFSSMKTALNSSLNSDFRRAGAFLAVIILSDEDDFSDPNREEGSWGSPGGIADHSYSNPGLETVDSYVSYLDALTQSTDVNSRNYNVSAVTVKDQACLNAHLQETSAALMGTRYIDLVTKTNGTLADICATNYAADLQMITKKIIELSTAFKLSREPVPASIVVAVNGNVVPNNATNGWTYNSTSNSIIFHGTAVPPQGASIQVHFDPVAPKS